MPPVDDDQNIQDDGSDGTGAGGDELLENQDGAGSDTPDGDDPDASGGADGADKGAGDGDDETPPSRKRTSKYIRELKRSAREAQAALEQERKARQVLEAKLNVKPEPSRESFDSDDAFIEAKAEWLADKKLAEKGGPQGDSGGNNLPEFAKSMVSAGMSVADAGYLADEFISAAKVHKDFQEKVQGSNYITKDLMEALVDLDDPGEVLYHLANNQGQLDELHTLSPRAMAIQLAKIEAKLESTTNRNPPKATSGAPAPITPIDGGRVDTDAVPGTGDQLSDDEWFKRENARLLKERGMG